MLTARYAALQSSYWSAFCLVINFVSVFLLAHGLTNAQIGVLMAVASAVATVVQPIVAGLVDRSRLPLRLWLVMGGIAVAALAAALLPQGGGMLVAIAYGLLVALIQVAPTVGNGSLSMDSGQVHRRSRQPSTRSGRFAPRDRTKQRPAFESSEVRVIVSPTKALRWDNEGR